MIEGPQMPNWYIYYRLLWSLRCNRHSDCMNGSMMVFWSACDTVRCEIQDILIDLRNKSTEELSWSDQQTQDFFESLVVQYSQNELTVDRVIHRIAEENKRLVEYGGSN